MAGGEPEYLAEDEYRRWLTPKQALGLLPNALQVAANSRALINRAWLGRVRTASEVIVVVQEDREDQAEFALLPPAYWHMDPPKWPNDFWTTGDHYVLLPSETGAIGRGIYVSLIGVRFEPAGVEMLRQQLNGEVPDVPVTSPEVAEKPIPKAQLSQADAKRFLRAILSEWPDQSEDWLREKATLFFANYRIPRDWFRGILRELRGSKKPGRPRKNN